MQNENGLTPAERELEAALGGLKPARASLNRDRVMFLAGRNSVRGQRRAWQGAAACLAVALVVSILSRPGARVIEVEREYAESDTQSVYHVSAPVDVFEPLDRKSDDALRKNIRLRSAVIYGGLDWLPASDSEPVGAEPPITKEKLEEILLST